MFDGFKVFYLFIKIDGPPNNRSRPKRTLNEISEDRFEKVQLNQEFG